mgnify:CR=1 FL=1
MGVITSRIIFLQDKFNEVFTLAGSVSTWELQDQMFRRVYHCFKALQPLSYKYIRLGKRQYLCRVYGKSELQTKEAYFAVGRWVNVVWSYQKYGTGIHWDMEKFFFVMRAIGEEVAKLVRRPIKKDFAELVKLLKELTPYTDLRFRKPVSIDRVYFFTSSGSWRKELTVTPIFFDSIQIETQRPHDLTLLREGKPVKTFAISDKETILAFEDLLDDAIQLYKRAFKQLKPVKEKNEEILKEMESIALPWKVTQAIKE